MHTIKRSIALLLLALTLVFPTGVFAADTATTSETLNVTASFTLTGVPATLTYRTSTGAAIGYSATAQTVTGDTDTATAGIQFPNIAFNSSYGVGTTLSVVASNLTGGVSPATINATARQLVYNGKVGMTGAASSTPVNDTTAVTIGDTSAVGDGSFALESNINLPAGALGNYSGSLVFTVTQ